MVLRCIEGIFGSVCRESRLGIREQWRFFGSVVIQRDHPGLAVEYHARLPLMMLPEPGEADADGLAGFRGGLRKPELPGHMPVAAVVAEDHDALGPQAAA